MSAYAAVLEVSNTYYCPTKIENYFDVFLEGGYTDALAVFIKRNAWGKERADRARKYLSTKKAARKPSSFLMPSSSVANSRSARIRRRGVIESPVNARGV